MRFSGCLIVCGLLALVVACDAAPPAPDYAPTMRHLLHWSRLPVRVLFAPSPLNTETRQKAVRTGFDRWTLATLGRVWYVVVDKNADVTVDFDAHDTLPEAAHVAGHTVMQFSGDVLRSAQMTLAVGNTDDADLSNTAAHEFGHALGIDGHSDNSGDLMAPQITRFVWLNGINVPALPLLPTARDVNSLKLCYPALWADTPNSRSH